ncbi:MAG: aspartate aminotransferase family protein [Fuerstiella sp.]|nr:aspartate aminotransferase family protein [Fuerstiella sp.]
MNATTSSTPGTFLHEPEQTQRIETRYRRIVTSIPAPGTLDKLALSAEFFPRVNCCQPPVLWDRADGFQVYDCEGNCWIDFSSAAAMTISGHGHPAVREAVKQHGENGLLAQFNYASEIRVTLAKRLLELAPPHCEMVYFWTCGSETNEAALRLARERGMRMDPEKYHILTHTGDYHGWTLGATQVSGGSAAKPWLTSPDPYIHHLPAAGTEHGNAADDVTDWAGFLASGIADLRQRGVEADKVAAVFIETIQGGRAVPWPIEYVRALRRWADAHDVLLVFDEVQTGFGRTGTWFGFEHYGVRADLICIGKGLTSSLPLAALLGPANVIDLLEPGQIATTHAGHPLSCAAALANLDVLESEGLIPEAVRKGKIVSRELQTLQTCFSGVIEDTPGIGLLHVMRIRNLKTGQPDVELARQFRWEAVKRGVMLMQTEMPTIKICPPLVISDDALIEGISAIGDAIEAVLQTC